MKITNKKVLVTGAAGFVGSHLVEKLVDVGCQVRCFIRYNSRGDRGFLAQIPPEKQSALLVYTGDLRDPEAVRVAMKDVDVVFHLGALIAIPYSYVNPREVVETNITGTLNVMQAARDHGVEKVVHTSTSEVYGTAQYVPMDEKHPTQGQSPYSASKIGADKIVESYHRSFSLPAVTLRPFNIYGPRQSSRAVIPTIISQLIEGDTVRLGDVTPTRDFTYVTDTAEAFIKVAESDNTVGGVFNAGSGFEVSIGDLVSKIADIMGKQVKVVKENERIRPDKSEVKRLFSDSSLAAETFGWRSSVSFEEGLGKAIDWIKTNLDQYRVGEYTR